MANVALHGSAEELGIGCQNLWLQPAGGHNGFDIFAGIDAFYADPLRAVGRAEEQLPLMLTFPSEKVPLTPYLLLLPLREGAANTLPSPPSPPRRCRHPLTR
jgi:hypothetical protein